MTTRKPKEAPNSVEAAGPDLELMETVITEAASTMVAAIPRLQAERNRAQMRVNELIREREDYLDRHRLLTAQFQAAESALLSHVSDIDSTLALLQAGLPVQEAAE